MNELALSTRFDHRARLILHKLPFILNIYNVSPLAVISFSNLEGVVPTH